jgi:hypothetical protein
MESSTPSMPELGVLLDERVFRLGEHAHEFLLGQRLQGADHGQASDELWNHAVGEQVFRLDLGSGWTLAASMASLAHVNRNP